MSRQSDELENDMTNGRGAAGQRAHDAARTLGAKANASGKASDHYAAASAHEKNGDHRLADQHREKAAQAEYRAAVKKDAAKAAPAKAPVKTSTGGKTPPRDASGRVIPPSVDAKGNYVWPSPMKAFAKSGK